jgi:hypothetical protein
MRLYVCWGILRELLHQHPSRFAFRALQAAGHEPEVRKVRGRGVGPPFLHWMTAGRREVERISGQRAVPWDLDHLDGGEDHEYIGPRIVAAIVPTSCAGTQARLKRQHSRQ